jgi:hypothetical protein
MTELVVFALSFATLDDPIEIDLRAVTQEPTKLHSGALLAVLLSAQAIAT